MASLDDGKASPGMDALQDLLREAAAVGPGLHGFRTDLRADERKKLAQRFRASGGEPPEYLEVEPQWIDRRAKLFEAGDYPDKSVTVTREDLVALAAGFDLPVPVLIEHAESPLELGYLTQVEAIGNELFGVIALTEEADRLVRRSGAKSLSLGLSPDMKEIREVSLVRTPRVASAQLFSDSISFETTLHEAPTPEGAWKARYDALLREQAHGESDRALAALVRGGKLTPAELPAARAILRCGDSVDFDGESRPLAHLLIAMIEKRPPMGLFSELTPATTTRAVPEMDPDAAEFYRRHFPDLSLEDIAQCK